MERDPAPRPAASLAPEHDWAAAASLVQPGLRPAGTVGIDGHDLRVPSGSGAPGQPLIGAGPAGLAVAYVIPGRGFGVLVGAEHLLAWGVGPDEVRAAATANLAAWSAGAPWVEEMEGRRRIVWSDSGEGMDAARILLPEVRAQLTADLGGIGRVLIGLPERDLLIATGLAEGDDEFAAMFAAYVADRSDGADEPVADRLFELIDGELIVFEGAAGGATGAWQ
ncbi:MAG: hypothetical protein ABSA21_12825 [Candidatus Limnocylindrales bacterium]|jgi:hypothetical protein